MKMQVTIAVVGMILAASVCLCAQGRSPENQVFQFQTTATFKYTDGPEKSATAYLWVPEKCRKLRGLIIMGRNVPEQWLAGHPAIRQACIDCDLGIVWACPSFLIEPKTMKNDTDVGAFLQKLLDGLAAQSGYDEVARVPWLPVGESYHLWLVAKLINGYPDRCIAGIEVKNAFWDIRPAGVPMLVAVGTCMEWDQEKTDLLNQWKNLSVYAAHRKHRQQKPDWPGSLLIEPGSGHFECTEAMAEYFGKYIRAAVKARVGEDGKLETVDLKQGVVTALPVPGAKAENGNQPWYFNAELARGAVEMAKTNWDAKTQVPVFADEKGKAIPFGRRGIFWPVNFSTGEDGITFQLHAGWLDRITQGWVHAGTELGHAAGEPVIEWICGNVVPLGGNRFQISLNRSWPDSPTYLRVWHPGDGTYRFAVQPGSLEITPNKNGKPQTIAFDAITDQIAGVKEIELRATADSGMPVRFFVRSGPAIMQGNRLVLTEIPPRTKFPLAVTVAAWQWGRSTEPAIQTAPIVERTFYLKDGK